MKLVGTHIPEPIKLGSKFGMGNECQLGQSVDGLAVEYKGRVYIPVIFAQERNKGHCGRFLDSLHPSVAICAVDSERLREMLIRRGWIEQDIDDPELDLALADPWDGHYKNIANEFGPKIGVVNVWSHPAYKPCTTHPI